MNSSQKLGLLILMAITACYVYFSFFSNSDLKISLPKKEPVAEQEVFVPQTENEKQEVEEQIAKPSIQTKTARVFFLNSSGKILSVDRRCDVEDGKDTLTCAMQELVKGPTSYEKSKNYTSEIPNGTKILSIRESKDSAMVDLSSDFETGGGAESIYVRVKQIIKTANANTKLPVFLYINGRQTNVIGGEGIMIKQPLNERSLDD